METVETMPGPSTTAANRAVVQRLMKAMRERDYDGLAELLAHDVVIRSPITASFHFQGRDDAIALLKIVRETMAELEHEDLLGTEDVWVQRFRARVRGRMLEGMDLMRFDPAGTIRELTVFVRPLPGVTAFAAAVAPGVGGRRGRLTSIALRLLTGPLAAITYHGDRLVAWLLRGTWW
jgi:ketosteroid isomerase-like protein